MLSGDKFRRLQNRLCFRFEGKVLEEEKQQLHEMRPDEIQQNKVVQVVSCLAVLSKVVKGESTGHMK